MPSHPIEGFHIQTTNNYKTLSATIWADDNNKNIFLDQAVLKDSYQTFLDNDSIYYKKTEINFCNVYYIEKNNSYFIVWSNGEYMFKMIFPNTIDFSEIEKIIESMEVVEN